MKLRIRTFGITRDMIGGHVVEIQLNHNRVKDLREMLLRDYPDLKEIKSLLIAVNQNYAADDLELKETDEIALIPPVSGG